MFRRYKNPLIAAFIFSACAAIGYYSVNNHSSPQIRYPAAIGDWTQADFDHATLSVSMSEFQESRPKVGRSYFDMIFSAPGSNTNTVQYQVPYPFNKIITKLEDYVGLKSNSSDSAGVKVTIFPMGRSLQRNAAIAGSNQPFSFDPFFRFPRIVMGVDGEPTHENSLLLNLKNKIYIGFNERAEILEAISYNEEEGRYEYQIIRDYAPGKTPKVSYANRSLCLSCHQNQTPIFSRGPWSESNANKQMADSMKQKMDAAFGQPACDSSNTQAYCYKNSNPYYFGAPVRIDESVSYRLDTSTDQGNFIHAYQKMWKELCTTSECKTTALKNFIMYRLNGNSGLIGSPEQIAWLKNIEAGWKNKWPRGLSIPSPNVPNRDPLKDISDRGSASSFSTVNSKDVKSVQDLLTQSKIPTEFEPLLQRQPIDIWPNSGIEINNTNRMIKGLSQEFTFSDIKMIDQWLYKNKTKEQILTELSADCSIDPDGQNLAISCDGKSAEAFSLNAYISKVKNQGDVSDFAIKSAKLNCDASLSQSDQNKFSGKSCPQMTDLIAGYAKVSDEQAIVFLQRRDGLSVRTLHGYFAAEVFINLNTRKASLKVYDQSPLVNDVMAKNANDIFKTTTFSRFQVMKSLIQYVKIKMDRMQNYNMNGLEMSVDGESASPTVLQANMTGSQIMKVTCAKCHANDEAVPPNFMGYAHQEISDVDQCRRIEQCAPRMIYRLKMRKCEKAQFQKKKNPMPPEFFLANNKVSTAEWQNVHNVKVLNYLNSLVNESELAQDLASHGLAGADAQKAAKDILSSECPESNSVIYDQLPKCEFNQLKPTTRCR